MLQWRKKLLIMITVLVVVLGDSYGQEAVSYDGKSLIIHGRRSILFSGSIHYPRSTPQMWPDLISKAKEGGLDVIQTYVFWNVHEPVKGMYNFNGRYDLVRFIKEVQGQGLYVSLRIGPFIEAEWTYGGLPFWLHDIPGIVYRSDNQPFKFYMEQFTRKIVNMMKSEKLYASQGGPIILSQIENEYQNVEARYGEMGTSYVKWAAQMAVSLDTGVPWVMCKQDDAPGPVINACNGMKCGETFAGPNSPSKPSIWTENWTSFVEEYGGEPYLRSAEDIAYAVTLFIIAKKGSFVNYYMYHGGTNFGRSAANYIKTSYYDQAPLDEYGMIRQPKWGHLKELHAAIKQCTPVLLWGSRSSFSLGAQQQGYVYQGSWGKCAAFLANNDPLNAATVNFRNSLYRLPPKSISILPDCKNVIFNTGWVNSHSNMRSITSSQSLYQGWERFTENLQNRPPSPFQSNGLSEQTSITKDKSDYLLYSTSYNYNGYPATFKLRVESLAHVVHAFINNHYAGNGHGTRKVGSFVFEISISLKQGINDISLLSVIVGLPNSGAHLESRYLGLRKVSLQNTNGEILDLSQYAWRYKIGMLGENLQLYKTEGLNKAIWIPLPSLIDRSSSPLTWFKTYFEAPAGNEPVVLNLASMSKGEAWINGESIGRYWVSFHTPKGVPSQSMYHIPRSFLNPSRNLLVIFEEMGGNPLHISIDTISNNRLCATVSESHSRLLPYTEKPTIQFQCPESKLISSVDFASFGTPFGACGEYKLGMCHSNSSRDIVHLACLGKTHCQIPVSIENLGDPCPGISKALSVEARCS